jgi:hypothetical protein
MAERGLSEMTSTYDVPECIVTFIRHRDLRDEDYYLYATGRALGWVRMAAFQLERTDDFKLAEYHAYAAICAARTSIDAFANFLNRFLSLGLSPPTESDLAKNRFRKQGKGC